MSIPIRFMYKVVHVLLKSTNELVYIGIINTKDASMPLTALRANYNSLSYKATADSDAMLYNKALENVGNELKKHFDDNGCFPRDNQKIYEQNYYPKIRKLLQSFSTPIEIEENVVADKIETGHQNGNYIYGHYKGKEFIVDYVGRCTDCELRKRIMHRWNEDDNNYKDFNKNNTNYARFRYAKNDDEAVDIECLLYHYYGGKAKLINNEHPSRENTQAHCPVCDEVKNMIK